MKKVLVIAGPTASGKTALSIKLAHYFKGEIISGDSQQVYQELMIGNAKITDVEKASIKHYGLDLINYDKSYSVKDFQSMARYAIDEIYTKEKLPIITGGTGFYLKACLYDYVFNDEMDEDDQFEELSNQELYNRLKEIDLLSLEKIHINNRKRLIRALNIGLKGQTKTEREAIQNHQPIYDVFLIVLDLPKSTLDQRIEKRLDTMFDSGLQEEVLRFFSQPETWNYQSFQGIGYKEWKEYLLKQSSLEDVKEKINVSTRQYAKRQLTWFRHQFNAYWYKPSEENEKILINQLEVWLKGIKMKKIVLAGGCFWGVEEYYRRLKGVGETRVGYAQGLKVNPTYQEVCSGQTLHAEVVEIEYDPSVISFEKMLEHLFRIIDPTSLNKQAHDVGTQYRVGVYPDNDEELAFVKRYVTQKQVEYTKPIVLEVETLNDFYDAETYHQKYLVNNPTGYCHVNMNLIRPEEKK